ncbi:hypothetical protein [Actinacidiphila sp. ITFR-21]|uniref:glycine-rich domain-containing protein n=1 Tax=Actinacidiphila sp. ITFR-21 TaxID=3075199 RepID=UPI002889B618|nr:hypothetical protein [Streptomyces sp. ITFR-21]WNI20292.1 hypothetical protein RLT57_33025 [Streptomyces sp. ITFR-21]
MSVDLAALLQAGPGITYDASSGTISANLSLDPGNATTYGSDDGLFTFSGGSGGPLALCDEYFQTDVDGKICLKPGSMGLREVVRFVTPGTFQFDPSAYPWLARVLVKVQAGGGGSAGARAAANQSIWRAGGAGGGYGEGLFPVAALGGAVTVTVGAGGAAGASANGAGGAGGNSSFGTLIAAIGGPGGSAPMASGTSMTSNSATDGPAAGTGGYLNLGGGSSEGAIRLNGSVGLSGGGGDSHLGHGGGSRAAAGVGNIPRGYGGGAGGSVSVNATAQAGRAGGGGAVIVELYG